MNGGHHGPRHIDKGEGDGDVKLPGLGVRQVDPLLALAGLCAPDQQTPTIDQTVHDSVLKKTDINKS